MKWLLLLVTDMLSVPADRPSASEALAQFKSMREELDVGIFTPRLRLKSKPEGYLERTVKSLFYSAQDILWAITPKPHLPPLT